MDDRHKFRVWDEQEGCYLDGRELEFVANHVGRSNFGPANARQHSFDWLFGPRYTVEYCVGVTDSNRQLVFEGDIVRYHTVSLDKEREGAVTFCCGGFLFGKHYVTHCNHLEWMTTIIGNVHESDDTDEIQR